MNGRARGNALLVAVLVVLAAASVDPCSITPG